MKAFETLVKQILLNETPSLVNNELLVDLNDPEINKQFLQKCLTTGVKLNNFEKWEVYKFKDFDDLYFCFIHEESVDAYAKFFIDGSEGYGRTVAQKRTDQTKGLLRRAFIKYFSKKFSSLILDRIANKYGKQFFKKLLQDAIENNFKVVVLLEDIKKEIAYNENDYEIYWKRMYRGHRQSSNPSNILFKIYYK
jgi:hypothetical protein